MLISKKRFCNLFKNYTMAIYRECGRNLSVKQRASILHQVNKLYQENTIRGKLKGLFNKMFKLGTKKQSGYVSTKPFTPKIDGQRGSGRK